MFTLPTNSRWSQNEVTVAGGNGDGNAVNQLHCPYRLDIHDDNIRIVTADWGNHRIVEWKVGASHGKVIAGGHGQGNRLDQLNWPTDVVIDKETNSFLTADQNNRRVLRWRRRERTTHGEVIVDNIDCRGLAMDYQRYLYVFNSPSNEVRRYTIGNKNGIVVDGGNGQGNQLNQLDCSTYVFVDEGQTMCLTINHRVMKWNKGAKEGIVVAKGRGEGIASTQLSQLEGLFVDTSGTIDVIDAPNDRVKRSYCNEVL